MVDLSQRELWHLSKIQEVNERASEVPFFSLFLNEKIEKERKTTSDTVQRVKKSNTINPQGNL